MPDVFDLEELYDEHAQALYACCLELTRSDADTKDVLQDLFTKISRQPKILKGVRNVRAYLLRLVHNSAIDLMRRRGTREKYVQETSRNSPQIFEANDDRDEEMFRQALSDALAELPEEQRAAVHLRLWEGLKFEEIAELLGISVNTVASRYRYAIDKLQQRLRPLYNEIK